MKKGSLDRFPGLALLSGVTLSLAFAGACSIQDSLLEQQQPQVISPTSVQNATGALGQYTGALGAFRTALNGHNNNQETIWNFEGLMTDEFKSGDTFQARNDADQRQSQSNDVTLLPAYNYVQQARGYARGAINALRQFSPGSTSQISEMYMEMGFMEMTLGQAYCGDIPLGETVGGVPVYSAGLTNAQVFASAIARFDSALAFNTGADAQSVAVKQATLIAKARALVDIGNYTAAAALVPGSVVPSGYQYVITYSVTTQNNEWWKMASTLGSRRYVVADSADALNGAPGTGTGPSLPFATANDPRISVLVDGKKAFDNATPMVGFQTYAQADPIPLVSGVDARLIEAEAQLNGGTNTANGGNAASWARMKQTLDSLRQFPPRIGNYQPAAMAPLPAFAVGMTAAQARAIFFREKAFWQFARGERISDLRRLMSQYGQTAAQTWPTGNYPKGGLYGANVALPVPQNAGNGSETSNPLFVPANCDPTKP